VFGALLSLIPFVGPGLGAVYIDRRRIPSTYDFGEALKTALIQLIAVAVLVLLFWVVFMVILGFSIELNPRLTGR
jgi:hypothetical protein